YDPERAVDRHACASAHGHAIDERYVRLLKMADRSVEAIFGREILGGSGIARPTPLVDIAKVAACAESTARYRIDHDRANGGLTCPLPHLGQHSRTHAEIQRVQRFGPVERDSAERAFVAKDYVTVHGLNLNGARRTLKGARGSL